MNAPTPTLVPTSTLTLTACGAALGLVLAAAAAHSPTESTHPADGSVLDAPPQTLRVSFAAPARVVKVVMTHAGEDGGASETRLAVPSEAYIEEMHLTPDFPGPGSYEIAWRALGEDGHVVKGSFAFSVR